jgi:hypothetical protein
LSDPVGPPGPARPGAAAGARVFLSGVRSRSHLLHVAAYLRYLSETAGVGHVHVVDLGLGAFLGEPRVTPADMDTRLPIGPRLSLVHASGPADWRARPGESLVYLAIGAPGIKPYLRLRLVNRRRLQVVVVDEGLGSYGGWRARWAAFRRQGGRGACALVRAVAVSTAARRLTDDRWALYRPGPTGWQLDPRIAAEFRARLPLSVGAASPDTAVLISQPWVELGQLSAGRYTAVLRGVQAACAAAGLALLVRPHPAEDPSHFDGLPVAHSSDPAELDRAVVDAGVVLGFNSTALVNLAAVYGTPVLRVAMPELAAVEAGMSSAQRSLLDAFLPPPVQIDELPAQMRALVGSVSPTGTGIAEASR